MNMSSAFLGTQFKLSVGALHGESMDGYVSLVDKKSNLKT